ncbi:MAG: FadR family transcriptional regulator [Ruminiclostridium sp.]|nr:FadR family transcriptional regulator [Ruminiclostridium sp.]
MQNFKKEKLYNLVYKEIKDYIIKNNLKPGNKLPTEHDLCDMLGVSRNVVREALKSLQGMGIIEPIPSEGNIIKDFNMDMIFEGMIYELLSDGNSLIDEVRDVRRVLEISYFEDAFNTITEKEIIELGEIVENIEEKQKTGQRTYEDDFKFHLTIFKNIPNKVLLSFLKVSWSLSKDLKKVKAYVSDKKSAITIHRKIYEAIRDRDLTEARKQMKIHFDMKISKSAVKKINLDKAI